MATYVLRVWLPDRPGALGAVASRIGAVRGDVVAIDILERGGGRVIDELVIELADDDLVDLLVAEVAQVDGVDVELVQPLVGGPRDPRLDALETAAVLVEEETVEGLLASLCQEAQRDFDACWAAVVDLEAPVPLTSVGDAPPAAWLSAFVAGSRWSDAAQTGVGPDDVAWADLPGAGLALVLGRQGRPFRARERRQLAALARIAGRRWGDLVRRAHPCVGRKGA